MGRFGAALPGISTDDLGAIPCTPSWNVIPTWTGKHWTRSFFGCTDRDGEDNGSVTRIGLLLARLPKRVPGTTTIARAALAWMP